MFVRFRVFEFEDTGETQFDYRCDHCGKSWREGLVCRWTVDLAWKGGESKPGGQ